MFHTQLNRKMFHGMFRRMFSPIEEIPFGFIWHGEPLGVYTRTGPGYSTDPSGNIVENAENEPMFEYVDGKKRYRNYAGRNKCECDGIPTTFTDGFILSGADISIIDSEIGKVYRLDNNTAGNLFPRIVGTVGNLNPHTGSVIARGTANFFLFSQGGPSIAVPTDFANLALEDYNPVATTQTLQFFLASGDFVEFRLPQLTETPYQLPDIPSSRLGPVTVNQPSLTLQASGAGAEEPWTTRSKDVPPKLIRYNLRSLLNGVGDGAEGFVDPDINTTCGVNWICGNGWSIVGGRAVSDGTVNGNFFEDTSYTTGDVVELEIDIEEFNSGSISTLFGRGTAKLTTINTAGIHKQRGVFDATLGADTGIRGTVFDGSINNISIRQVSPAVGSIVFDNFNTRQVIAPDLPRTFALVSGDATITGDVIDFDGGTGGVVSDIAYWDTKKTYKVNATVSGSTGTANITLPYDGADNTDAYGNSIVVTANGTYEYIYIPGTDLLQVDATVITPPDAPPGVVTVNSIKEVQTLVNTNDDVPVFYINPDRGRFTAASDTGITCEGIEALTPGIGYDTKFIMAEGKGWINQRLWTEDGSNVYESGLESDIDRTAPTGELIYGLNTPVYITSRNGYFDVPKLVQLVDELGNLMFDEFDEPVMDWQ